MNEPEILKPNEFKSVIELAIEDKVPCVMSHLSGGKWHMTKITLSGLGEEYINADIVSTDDNRPINIQTNQPVGISIQREYNKYIFETSINGYESSINESLSGKISFLLPFSMERMQRRAFMRVPVPRHMNVKVLFWHRGYNDDTTEVPIDNYWQGRLIDLSAGGLQIQLDDPQKDNFKAGQFIGLQFTPKFYERPLITEAQIKHIDQRTEQNKIYLGAEFLGLEASMEGRHKLRRIIRALDFYQTRGQGQISQDAASVAMTEAQKAAEPLDVPDNIQEEQPSEHTDETVQITAEETPQANIDVDTTLSDIAKEM